MTGKELLEKLTKLKDYELDLDVLVGDDSHWFYDIHSVRISDVEEGREVDYLVNKSQTCIILD